jgi:hypothetical protein
MAIASGQVSRVSRVIHIALEQKKGVNGIISTLQDAGDWQVIALRILTIDRDMAQV